MTQIKIKNIQKVNPNAAERATKPLLKSNTIKSIDVIFNDNFMSIVKEVMNNQTDKVTFYDDGSAIYLNKIGSLTLKEYKQNKDMYKNQASVVFDEKPFTVLQTEFLAKRAKTKRETVYRINVLPSNEDGYLAKIILVLEVKTNKKKGTILFYKDITKYLVNKIDILSF